MMSGGASRGAAPLSAMLNAVSAWARPRACVHMKSRLRHGLTISNGSSRAPVGAQVRKGSDRLVARRTVKSSVPP